MAFTPVTRVTFSLVLLTASLLATVPIWRNMDPLAILVTPKKEKKKPGKGPDDPAAPEPAPDERVEDLFTDEERS